MFNVKALQIIGIGERELIYETYIHAYSETSLEDYHSHPEIPRRTRNENFQLLFDTAMKTKTGKVQHHV
jgi:hypothetical protein